MNIMPEPFPTDHTFAVCAYKDSPYLEKCLSSVVSQIKKSNVIMCTPTPTDKIKALAEKYDVPLFINPDGNADMQGSWNFAVSKADTSYVTVCHQDDYYSEGYFAAIENFLTDDLLFLHTAYTTAYTDSDGNTEIKKSKNIIFKRIIHAVFANRWQQDKIFFKRWDLRFGNSVCCPTCTYSKKNLEQPIFTSQLKHGVDWDLYISLASRKGRIAYIKKPVAFKRIHLEAQTNQDVASGVRAREDIELYSRLWPKPFAKVMQKILIHFYNAG